MGIAGCVVSDLAFTECVNDELGHVLDIEAASARLSHQNPQGPLFDFGKYGSQVSSTGLSYALSLVAVCVTRASVRPCDRPGQLEARDTNVEMVVVEVPHVGTPANDWVR